MVYPPATSEAGARRPFIIKLEQFKEASSKPAQLKAFNDVPFLYYLAHCWRRTSATNAANNGASTMQMRGLYSWKSDKMCAEYVDNSKMNLQTIAGLLQPNCSGPSSSSTSASSSRPSSSSTTMSSAPTNNPKPEDVAICDDDHETPKVRKGKKKTAPPPVVNEASVQ
jgi:hypothetical protein